MYNLRNEIIRPNECLVLNNETAAVQYSVSNASDPATRLSQNLYRLHPRVFHSFPNFPMAVH